MQRIAVATVYRFVFGVGVLLLSLATSAANSDDAISAQTEGLLFSLAGSNTLGAHLAPAWAKAYLQFKGLNGVLVEPLATDNEYRVTGRNGSRVVYIDIRAHGSSTGFEGLLSHKADIALSSRPIKATEAKRFNVKGGMQSSASEHVVAIDGLAVIVHPGNVSSALTVDVIAKIFTGKITHWKALGGPDRRINLYARDNKSGTFDTFKSLVLGKNGRLSMRAKRFESNDALSDTVAVDPDGIGFVGLASVRNAKPIAVSDKNTAALQPENLFVATEDYPLSRRLFIYTPGNSKNDFVQDFVDFAQGTKGQDIVESIGFVSQNPKVLSLDVSNGPPRYQALAGVMKRLSINFRFQPGQADLDNKALQDIERLATFIAEKNVAADADLHVQLVGFSNSDVSAKRAHVLSDLRATAVKRALYRRGIRTESIVGFGDRLRVANDEGLSSSKNDRVEVWLFTGKHLAAVNGVKERMKRGDNGPTFKALSQQP